MWKWDGLGNPGELISALLKQQSEFERQQNSKISTEYQQDIETDARLKSQPASTMRRISILGAWDLKPPGNKEVDAAMEVLQGRVDIAHMSEAGDVRDGVIGSGSLQGRSKNIERPVLLSSGLHARDLMTALEG